MPPQKQNFALALILSFVFHFFFMFQISYDDLLGTRSRHYAQPQFSISGLRSAGVTEAMLREAYPGGIPDTSFTGIIHLSILCRQMENYLLSVK